MSVDTPSSQPLTACLASLLTCCTLTEAVKLRGFTLEATEAKFDGDAQCSDPRCASFSSTVPTLVSPECQRDFYGAHHARTCATRGKEMN